eukprot:scaffold2868_cov171-Amphora_coffeaeformis.AAC.9
MSLRRWRIDFRSHHAHPYFPSRLDTNQYSRRKVGANRYMPTTKRAPPAARRATNSLEILGIVQQTVASAHGGSCDRSEQGAISRDSSVCFILANSSRMMFWVRLFTPAGIVGPEAFVFAVIEYERKRKMDGHEKLSDMHMVLSCDEGQAQDRERLDQRTRLWHVVVAFVTLQKSCPT